MLSVLCDAGLPLLLRYAVDDSSMAVIAAALAALHSLLVPQYEEVSVASRQSRCVICNIPSLGLAGEDVCLPLGG